MIYNDHNLLCLSANMCMMRQRECSCTSHSVAILPFADIILFYREIYTNISIDLFVLLINFAYFLQNLLSLQNLSFFLAKYILIL